jgi:hypothetical protein
VPVDPRRATSGLADDAAAVGARFGHATEAPASGEGVAPPAHDALHSAPSASRAWVALACSEVLGQ